jgi:hypothetical protein
VINVNARSGRRRTKPYTLLGSSEGETFSSEREFVRHPFRPPSAHDTSLVAGRITPLSVNSRKAFRFCRYLLICCVHRTVVTSRSRCAKKESERIRRDSAISAVATHATEYWRGFVCAVTVRLLASKSLSSSRASSNLCTSSASDAIKPPLSTFITAVATQHHRFSLIGRRPCRRNRSQSKIV